MLPALAARGANVVVLQTVAEAERWLSTVAARHAVPRETSGAR